jgi:hypothetical protein
VELDVVVAADEKVDEGIALVVLPVGVTVGF